MFEKEVKREEDLKERRGKEKRRGNGKGRKEKNRLKCLRRK